MSDIRATIQDYVEGACLGNKAQLKRVLHPDFETAGYHDGKLIWFDRDEVLHMPGSEGMPQWSMSDPAVHGDTAQTVVISDWKGRKFTEIVTLIRVDGDWQLVFKSFHIE